MDAPADHSADHRADHSADGRADDEAAPTATPVVLAIALGVAPLPFLAIYTVLFVAHGWLHPVSPPDITDSQHGELIAGLIALVLFVLMTLSIASFLNRRRRWFFGLGQLATLAASAYALGDTTTGPSGIPLLLVVTSAIALAVCALPVSARHVRTSRPAAHSAQAGPLLRLDST